MLSSLICSIGGAGGRGGAGVGGGDCWDDRARSGVAGPITFSPILTTAFKIPEHFVFSHPKHLVHL